MQNQVKEKLEAIYKIANGGLSQTDFTKAFKTLTAFVKKVKDSLEVRFIVLEEKIDNRLSRIKDGYTPVKGKDYFDGKDGERGPQGVQGATGEQGESIQGLNGADGSPDTPKLIRDKLEFLEADQRLDISAIRGLRKRLTKLEERPLGGKGGGGLSYISLDQHFFEDEVPTNSGDNKTFTLSTSPNPVNSLHLYRGGARQQLNPTGTTDGDFSLSGNTITLNVDLVSGEIILCDFRA